MSFQDKQLVCSDCGKEFTFTANEQEFYQQKGFENEPKRCQDCRAAKKAAFRANRESFPVTCAECGTDTTVPFKPRGDKPVLCIDCFRKAKPAQA